MFSVPKLNLNDFRENFNNVSKHAPVMSIIKWDEAKQSASTIIKKIPRPDNLSLNLLFNKYYNKKVGHILKDDIVEMFINVIQVEDEEENPQQTFYNHPERRRRTDREEIRKKLAMGADDIEDEAKLTKKPSLHSRLQNGKNLQICFMNETASDCESQCSDTESTQDRIDELEPTKDMNPKDFATHQARLQEEARLALSQAKQMARMQMQLEKQHQIKSPITEIVRGSFHKVGFPCPDSKRRMSRQILTDMNVAQLQIIVNEFHTQIENLNEVLVKLLLRRDDLHMEQDSMLVDIEDLNKHLGAKDGCLLLAQNDKKAKARPTTKSFKLKSFASSK